MYDNQVIFVLSIKIKLIYKNKLNLEKYIFGYTL